MIPIPLVDEGYFIPSKIMLYTAPVGTTAPDITTMALDAPPGPWVINGHVGDESGDGAPSFTRDGGDVTTKGSMSKRAIRQVVAAVTTGLEVDMTQFTRSTLALYHATQGGTTPGKFDVYSTDNGSINTAVLVVWSDGATTRIGLYAAKGSWTGRDSIDTGSVEDAIKIPLAVTFLDPDGSPAPAFSWLSPTLLALS